MREDQHSIILVEDDKSMSVALERVLKTAGYAVHAFLNAETLLAQGVTSRTNCLIFDLCLPGIQGLELLDRLRKSGVDQPAIVITARDKPEIRTQALAGGACAYLPKPVASRDLLEAVRLALQPAGGSPSPTHSNKQS